MPRKEDLRIRKTRANFYRALLELLEEKDFEDIKVIDICKVSTLNRSTFYDHFNDKYELLNSLTDYLKIELLEQLNIDKKLPIKEYLIEIANILLTYLDKNKKTIKVISNDTLIYNMIFDATYEIVNKKISTDYINKSNLSSEIISSFYVSGITRLCINKPNNIETYLNYLLDNINYLKLK